MGWAVVKQDICDNQRFPVAVFDWGVQNVTILSIYKVDGINWLRRRGMFPVNIFTEATAAVWIQLLLETRELKCGGRRTGLWSPRANSLLDSTPTSQYYCTPEKKGGIHLTSASEFTASSSLESHCHQRHLAQNRSHLLAETCKRSKESCSEIPAGYKGNVGGAWGINERNFMRSERQF